MNRRNYFAAVYPRLAEIVQLIRVSGLIATPAAADLASSELRPCLNGYLETEMLDAEERVALFRLAWDAATERVRQQADAVRALLLRRPAARLNNSCNKERYVDRIRELRASGRAMGS